MSRASRRVGQRGRSRDLRRIARSRAAGDGGPAGGSSLASLLLADDRGAARDGVVAYARALATMHASTVGREDTFVPDLPSPWVHWTTRAIDGLLTTLESLHIDSAGVQGDCDAVVAELGDSRSPWRTFVHGDPCPDNTRIERATGRFRIFDFEHSAYGHALTDAAYVLAPFPTCWCIGRVPDDVSVAAIRTYREVLATTVPEAADDAAWYEGLTVALAAPVISRGGVLANALAEDQMWGTAGMRVRLRQWIASFLGAAAVSGRVPALHRATQDLAAELARRWPEATMPDYPGLPTGAATVVEAPDWWTPGL